MNYHLILKRKDIPDAFIYENIINIYDNGKNNTIAIINDESLGKACEKAGVKVFKNLDEFIRSKDYKNLYKDNYMYTHQVEISKKLFERITNNYNEEVDDELTNFIFNEGGMYEIGTQLGINVDHIEFIDINLSENMNYLGSGIFTCYFNLKSKVRYLDLKSELSDELDVYTKEEKYLNLSGRINIRMSAKFV